MDFDWDSAKAAANEIKHEVSFDAVHDFEWSTASIVKDDRVDYGEIRFKALGLIGSRLYVLIYTIRDERTRLISLRKANEREQTEYGEHTG